MQARVRQQISCLCQTLGPAFIPTFGAPEALVFGGEGSEGSSNSFARADHVHAIPAIPTETFESFGDFIVYVDDFAYRSTAGTTFPFHTQATAVTSGGEDNTGEAGAWGSINVSRTNVGTAFILFNNTITATLSSQNMVVRRLRRFECRVRAPYDQTENSTCRIAVGFIRSTSALNLTNVTDCLMFHLDLTGGAANWQAVARDNSSETKVDTGRTVRYDASNDTKYEWFRIDYDGSKAYFYMGTLADDGTIDYEQVATISGNIPVDSRKVAGIIMGIEVTGSVTRSLSADFILYKGLRVYES